MEVRSLSTREKNMKEEEEEVEFARQIWFDHVEQQEG
jgi:hypothetical protein